MESIGKFSRRSGIPVSHLRHYHEVGLLQPACIDPESGYRYYARAQGEAAEVIGILRSIDMPVRDVQRLLADPSEANVREILAAHRMRLEERLTRVAGRLESIDRIVKEGKLVQRSHQGANRGFVAVRVEQVDSQIPSAERWNELREKQPMLLEQTQEVHIVTLITDTGRRVPLWVGSFEGHALRLHVDGIKTERSRHLRLDVASTRPAWCSHCASRGLASRQHDFLCSVDDGVTRPRGSLRLQTKRRP